MWASGGSLVSSTLLKLIARLWKSTAEATLA
jgi:hypothetical protein